MASRPLPDLLQIIGADPNRGLLLPSDPRILEAYRDDRITSAEARTLVGFAKADFKSQKRCLSAAKPASASDIEKMRAKLAELRVKLHEQNPHLRSDSGA